MKLRSVAVALAATALFAQGGFAKAGENTDALSKCLVKSTTDTDRTALVVWIYGAMSVHPALKTFSAMSEDQRTVLNKRAAALFERLMTADCRAETVAAMKYEGTSAFQNAFGTLGKVAMLGLVSNPDVTRELASIESYVDKSKFDALGKESNDFTAAPPHSK